MASFGRALVPLLGSLLLAAGGCDAEAPPRGVELLLKGGNGAQCRLGRQCQSGICQPPRGTSRWRLNKVAWRCKDKPDKVGFGKSCLPGGCLKGHHCDKKWKKCAINIKCEMFKDRLTKCRWEIFRRLWPKLYRKYWRRSKRFKDKLATRAVDTFYKKYFCKINQQRIDFFVGKRFVQAYQKKSCTSFAWAFNFALKPLLK